MMRSIGSDFADPHPEQHDIPSFVLGALDPAEALQVRNHLASCPACSTEGATYQAVVGLLCYAMPAQEPPAQLRERILTRIAIAIEACAATSA
jgi:anti-sigma factor RsiW